MMQLYWSPRSRSFTALWLMEETGKPYERVLTDISTGAQKKAEYLAINPMGKVPALKDGEATLAEAAAICTYVAERYPDAKLAPPLGDPQRAKYLYWLFFAPGCVEPAMVQLATKIEMNPVAAGWGEAQRVFDVLDVALAKHVAASRRLAARTGQVCDDIRQHVVGAELVHPRLSCIAKSRQTRDEAGIPPMKGLTS